MCIDLTGNPRRPSAGVEAGTRRPGGANVDRVGEDVSAGSSVLTKESGQVVNDEVGVDFGNRLDPQPVGVMEHVLGSPRLI